MEGSVIAKNVSQGGRFEEWPPRAQPPFRTPMRYAPEPKKGDEHVDPMWDPFRRAHPEVTFVLLRQGGAAPNDGE